MSPRVGFTRMHTLQFPISTIELTSSIFGKIEYKSSTLIRSVPESYGNSLAMKSVELNRQICGNSGMYASRCSTIAAYHSLVRHHYKCRNVTMFTCEHGHICMSPFPPADSQTFSMYHIENSCAFSTKNGLKGSNSCKVHQNHHQYTGLTSTIERIDIEELLQLRCCMS